MFRQYNAGASRPADIRLGLFVLDGLSPSKPIERNPLSPDPPFLMFVYYPYLLFFFELPLFFSFFFCHSSVMFTAYSDRFLSASERMASPLFSSTGPPHIVGQWAVVTSSVTMR